MKRIHGGLTIDESSAIRKEMKEMSTAELKIELEKICRIAPNSTRAALFSMEIQTRILWEKRQKENKYFISR